MKLVSSDFDHMISDCSVLLSDSGSCIRLLLLFPLCLQELFAPRESRYLIIKELVLKDP